MLATLDPQKYRSFFRARFSIARVVEIFTDPLLIVLCLLITATWYGERIEAHYIILGLIAFSLTFPGNLQLSDSPARMTRKTVVDWVLVAAMLLVFGYASGYERFYPDKVIFTWLAATLVALPLSHYLIRANMPRALSASGVKTAVIVGGNDLGVTLANQLLTSDYSGIRPLGVFDDRTIERLNLGTRLPFLGRMSELAEFVKHKRVDHIYIALPMASQPRILSLLDELKDTTASVYFVPDIFMTDLIQGRMECVAGMPVVAVCETPFTGLDGAVKRVSDLVLASIILVMISPLLLACAIGVKRSSPGPIIFKQRRYGLDGREILVYKFRSMSVTENGDVVKQATKNDARVTPFGAFIRRTSLDELPQFINVLQGRMSIVGPRPHAVAHNETYRKLIKGYMVRHKVKPGITGWAQVNGCRGETDTVDKMEARIRYDLDYLRNWSLGLDLWIIVKTFLVVAVKGDQQAY
ncbi:undecaprenyl-phosphate glucose phosphotransferase [Uliginosibacterium sp. sgz301328]|uniref:undecaprenyl-phosphate glucose phosphotransferase n=1 Tax=Uliginosibacterium sp. sgz301328 TaxID=3243764 RepID=UPI00359D4FEB